MRSGSVLLIGSRLDTGWTALPFQAEFVPFIDVLLNRLARGEVASLEVAAGDAGNRTGPGVGGGEGSAALAA